MVIPYGRPVGTSGEWRLRSFNWLAARWAALCPEYEVIVAAPDDYADPGTFNRPQAINRAVLQASGAVLIVADADTAFDAGWPQAAVESIYSGRSAWVLPQWYRRLARRSTSRLVRRDPDGPIEGIVEEETEYSWSGLVVVPRDGFDACGGFDERFTGWGHDDIAFGVAMETLWGYHSRLPGQATHLWHPSPLEHNYGQPNNTAQRELAEEYVAAADDVAAMRAVRFG